MGAIDSLDLFGLDEMIIFSYYYNNRNRYNKVVDVGANIGLYSIYAAKTKNCNVFSFEPSFLNLEFDLGMITFSFLTIAPILISCGKLCFYPLFLFLVVLISTLS